jgi:putative hydrolase of the HAD superfamily
MSSVPRLEAVIFDYGAVLCHLPTAEQLDEFSAVARLARDEFWTLYLATRAPYDRGSLDARGYWNYFGERAGRKYSDTEIERLSELDINVWLSMNDSMLEVAREVRNAGITTAILSNMPADLMHVIRREADWLGLFDKHFFSCEIGAVKPEPEIYQYVVKSLQVAPDSALLIDDNPENIASARKFGMRALHFESFNGLVPKLAAELDGAGSAVMKLLKRRAKD